MARVMLQHRAAIADGVFEAGYFETDYAAFMAWRDFGHPGPVVRNGFAMAALRAADGAFLLREAWASTRPMPARSISPPARPIARMCRPDGTLDLAGSVTRELCEETGLTARRARGRGGLDGGDPGRAHRLHAPGRGWRCRPRRRAR